MKVEKELLEDNRVSLDIEVKKEVVNRALQKAYQKIVKDVKLPGFRQGKVPRQILEARFGKEVLYQDAIDFVIAEVLPEALYKNKINPIDRPELNDIYLKENEPARIKITVEVPPKVVLGKYTGLAIEKEVEEVKTERIDEAIEDLRSQHATLIVSERSVVEEGDYVLIDFEGFLAGEPFEGGKGDDYMLGIGSKTFVPGFEEQLIGAELGSEKEIEVTFPADYREEKLAGQEVTFKVNIKDIKEKELPAVDDDFAKTVGDYDNIEALKSEIRKNFQAELEDKAAVKYENEVLDAVAAGITLEIPEKMITNRLEGLFQEMANMYRQGGIEMEDFLQATGSSVEEWFSNYRPVAEKQVRNHLILDAVVEAEKYSVDEAEIDEEILKVTKGQKEELNTIKTFMRTEGTLGLLETDILRKKAIHFLMKANKVNGEKEDDDTNNVKGQDSDRGESIVGDVQEVDGEEPQEK